MTRPRSVRDGTLRVFLTSAGGRTRWTDFITTAELRRELTTGRPEIVEMYITNAVARAPEGYVWTRARGILIGRFPAAKEIFDREVDHG